MEKEAKILLISDFNIEILGNGLLNVSAFPIQILAPPFGQVMPILVDASMPCWQEQPNFVVIWTQPENVIKSFKLALNFSSVPIDNILAEVDEFAEALGNMSHKVKAVFVPTWVIPTYVQGYGFNDMKENKGIGYILLQMNLRLIEKLTKAKNIYVLNAQKWIESAGKKAFNPQLWYMAKVPFGNEVFREASLHIISALSSLSGHARKIIMLDLDDTLWGGILGEVGWKELKLGGHDPQGEAFVDFQHALRALLNRGILLGLISKNEESVALDAIERHPEMILKKEDFAGWRINWEDKAKNIVDLTTELNLGLNSVVFIDNNPFEQGLVREALPEVFVPDWPEDVLLFKKTLLSLSCFDSPSFSQEDLHRTRMYATERERQEFKTKVRSMEEWVKTLGLKVSIEEFNEVNGSRATQLFNKTNQMNLTTRRMSESELVDWAKQSNHKVWTFRCLDKFGDSGLIGLISLEVKGETGWIVDFVLSCRVFGRKIEEIMLYILIQYARSMKLKEVYAQYIATAKNSLCLEFFKRSLFQYKQGDEVFCWNLGRDFPVPPGIEIQVNHYA